MGELRTPNKYKHGRYMIVLYNKPHECGGNCIYCFGDKKITKGTISNEDTLMAKQYNWSANGQFLHRINVYDISLGSGKKFELRIKGDSFTYHDMGYIESFVKEIYDTLNGKASETFEEARDLQKDAPDRCVHISVETRPDKINPEWCEFMIRLGVRTVEIGVQSLFDDVLERVNRGHTVDTVIQSTKMLRKFGFEVGYHIMPGLPGSTVDKDFEMLAHTLWQDEFFPDSLKIYPCILMTDFNMQPGLYKCLSDGWKPLNDGNYSELLREVFPYMPDTVHVNRIQRNVPENSIAYGPSKLIDRSVFNGISRCLWQRSVQNNDYALSGDFINYRIECFKQGDGFCVQALFDKDTVLGYSRLSFNDHAIIRDLRVLGVPLSVGSKNIYHTGVQHIGIGKAMIDMSIKTAGKMGYGKVVANPSPGVINYFAGIGFKRDGLYSYSMETGAS